MPVELDQNNDDVIDPSYLGRTDTKMPAGFVDRADSTLSFDNSTHVFTIAPASTSFTFYTVGNKFTKTTTQTIDLDNIAGGIGTDTTLNFIYFDADGKLAHAKSAWTITSGLAPVAIVNWNGSAGAILDERHGVQRDLAWHSWAHHTIGTRYQTGFDLTRPTTTNDRQIELGIGTIYDEDIPTTSTTANGKLCRLLRESSAGVYTWINGTDNSGYDIPVFWNSGTSKVQYNNGSYTLTDLTNAQYYPVFVYAVPDSTRPIWILTPTGSPYSTIGQARTSPTPVTFSPEAKLLYRWIYRGDGEFQESEDFRTSSPVPGGGSVTVAASSVAHAATDVNASTNVQAAIYEAQTEATFNSQSDSYELVITDAGKTILMGKGTAQTLTIPANASVAFPVGTVVNVVQTGAGQVTVAITSDTLNSSGSKTKLTGQYSAASLVKTASTTWLLAGDITT